MFREIPAHDFLNAFVTKEIAFGECAEDIIVDKFKDLFLLGILLKTGIFNVGIDHYKILLPLALQCLQLVVLVGWHVFQQ